MRTLNRPIIDRLARVIARGQAQGHFRRDVDPVEIHKAVAALGTVALGAFVLAALGSFWLARTLTEPIDRLATEMGLMTAAHVRRIGSVSITPRALIRFALWTSLPHLQCIKERTRSLPPNMCGGSF